MPRRFLTAAAVLVLSIAPAAAADPPKPVKELPFDPKERPATSRAWLGFTPDGTRFVARYYPGVDRTDRIRVWEVAGWKEGRSYRAEMAWGDFGCPCTFHPDGRLIFVDGGNVRIRDLDPRPTRPEVVLESPEHDESRWGNPTSIVWLTDEGKRCLRMSVYPGLEGVTVDRWDLADPGRGRRVVKHEEMKFDHIDAAAFDPVRGRLATHNETDFAAGGARLVRVWELPAKKDLGSLKHLAKVTSIAFGPEGESLAVGHTQGDGAAVRVWDAKTGRMRSDYGVPILRAYCLAVSPDGKRLAAAGMDKDRTGRACLLDAATGRVLAVWAVARGTVDRVCFSPTGDLLATLGSDAVIRLWDVDKLAKRGR